MTELKLLLDADMLVHKATVSVEKDVCFEERYHILMSDFEDALGLFTSMLYDVIETAGTDDLILFFSDDHNWRKDFDETYKGHRKSTRKPLAYWDLIDDVSLRYPTIKMPGLEADDALGIYQTSHPNTVIWSGDKDLKQIPGLHVGLDEVYEITPEEGHLFHMFQTLSGDTADGYAGCPGIGDTTAIKLLNSGNKLVPYEHELKSGKNKGTVEVRYREEPADSLWEIVVSAYEKAGLTEDHALHQARLSRILQSTDITSEGKPILWSPVS